MMDCIRCELEEATTGDLCRDCDIDKAMEEWPRCACGALLLNPQAKRSGWAQERHKLDCPRYEPLVGKCRQCHQEFEPQPDQFTDGFCSDYCEDRYNDELLGCDTEEDDT